jgi:hypothetical protein
MEGMDFGKIKYFTGYVALTNSKVLPPAARFRLDGYTVVHKVPKYGT